jgi:hypothetical protein
MLYFIKLLKSKSHKFGKYELLNNIYSPLIYRSGKFTIQSYILNKRQRIPKMAITNWQSRETQDEDKQKQIHNTIYVGHLYAQTNATNRYSPRDVQHYFLHHYIIIRIITKLPNSEQSFKGKVKTHIHLYLVILNISSTVDKSIVI